MCNIISMQDYSFFSKHIHKILSLHFDSLPKPHLKTLSDLIVAFFFHDNFTLRDIAAHIPSPTHVKHKLKRLQNFLDRLNVDEEFWRGHVRLIFTLPYFYPIRRKKIVLLMDSTTLRNKYWVFALSVTYRNRAIPVYMGIWEGVKKKYQFWDRMREVIEMGKKILPSRYEYEIVADNGFGGNMMWEICDEMGWDYVTGINYTTSGEKIEGAEHVQLSLFHRNPIEKPNLKKGVNLVTTERNGNRWYLATNREDRKEVLMDYKEIMWMEKSFRDLKVRLKWEKFTEKLPLKHRIEKLLIVSVMSYAIQLSLGGMVDVPRNEEESKTIISRFRHIYLNTWRTAHLIFLK